MNLRSVEETVKHLRGTGISSLSRSATAPNRAVGAAVEEELTGGAGSRYRMAGAVGASAPRQPRRIAAPDCGMGTQLFLVVPGQRNCHNQLACPDQAHTGGSMALILPAHPGQASAMETQQKPQGVQQSFLFPVLLFLADWGLVSLTRKFHWLPPSAQKLSADKCGTDPMQ